MRIYTDGSCLGNPGPGGWAYGDTPGSVVSGSEANTTNNRMELQAAIKGLESVPDGSGPTVVTDSSYVKNGVTKWAAAWQRNGWRLSGGGAVKNRDLWELLVDLSTRKGARWEWVKAHSGDVMNEAVDAQARNMALTLHVHD